MKIIPTTNNTSKSQRFSLMRFIVDDIKYNNLEEPTSPPFNRINLNTGDLMREDWSPRIY